MTNNQNVVPCMKLKSHNKVEGMPKDKRVHLFAIKNRNV